MSFEACPKCKSHQIEGDSFDCDNSQVSQEMKCLDCEATWVDIYVADRRVFEDEE